MQSEQDGDAAYTVALERIHSLFYAAYPPQRGVRLVTNHITRISKNIYFAMMQILPDVPSFFVLDSNNRVWGFNVYRSLMLALFFCKVSNVE